MVFQMNNNILMKKPTTIPIDNINESGNIDIISDVNKQNKIELQKQQILKNKKTMTKNVKMMEKNKLIIFVLLLLNLLHLAGSDRYQYAIQIDLNFMLLLLGIVV